MERSLPNITALRFFLAILVILYHLPSFSFNRGFPYYDTAAILHKGTEAVYAFFSLSGFLIIKNLYQEKSRFGQISIKNFYKRRVLRIFPLYYAVLFFGLLYYNVIIPNLGINTEEKNYSILEALILGGTFFSNILAGLKPGGILEILWSIGVEEQFYLLIAPVIFLLPLKNIFWFLLSFTIVYFLMFNLELPFFLKSNKMYFYFFSLSGIAAIFYTEYSYKLKINLFVKLFIYATAVVYFFTDYFIISLTDMAYQLISLILFPLCILCLVDKPVSFLENPVLKYFGKISYGIYMLHAIVFQITGVLVIKIFPGLLLMTDVAFIIFYTLLNIILTIFAAHISYRYFESYFLKFKTKKED